jgi:DNA-binding SARP family transcriptional activator
MVKLGVLALEHGGKKRTRAAWAALERAADAGYLRLLKWWSRRYAGHAHGLVDTDAAESLLVRLCDADPEGWRDVVLELVPRFSGPARRALLDCVVRHANRTTVAAMRSVSGRDIADARRYLQRLQATRLYVQTFGQITVRRGGWSGPIVPIDKKRVRAMLGVLAAHSGTVLPRDLATDLLWPDSDGDAAVNSLNQTVFQLRRMLDSSYRTGDTPEYVISTSDQVGFDPDLVHTDLDELRRLGNRLIDATWTQRQEIATRMVSLVKGEFLAELKYEPWASRMQLLVQADVRRHLLPIAQGTPSTYRIDVATRAAHALLALDQFDEAAMLALVDCLAASGQRVAARDLLLKYAGQLRDELDLAPSANMREAAERFSLRQLSQGPLDPKERELRGA